MCSKVKVSLLFLAIFTLMQNLHASRECAVAGSFYSNDKNELNAQLTQLLKTTKTFEPKDVKAIIVPHAGYIFSAQTAVTAYKTLNKKYKNIFLIGSSHHINIDSASIYNIGNYKTPLGEIKTNHKIVSELMKNSELFSFDKNAHAMEHTLEVQLPFLQKIYGDDLSIVPIIMATSNLQTIINISKTLKQYFNDENLFVISTDLSHFPSYEDANSIDKKTINSISTNNTQDFIDNIVQNDNYPVDSLSTTACGWASVLTLMYLTKDENYNYELLDYKNSGDSKYGDKERVVGYTAMRIYKNTDEFTLSEDEKNELLELAKLSLYEATTNHKRVKIDESKISSKLKTPLGAFVTLNKNKNLRGCIGRFEPNQPLYEVVIDMAIAAAQHDTRFKRVTQDELKDIEIEISVLTPRKQISTLDEIKLGEDGIYIQKGSKHGTYLPHVATQTGWSVEEFVRSCAVDKAGISVSEIKDADVFTYKAIVFSKDN